MIFAVILICSVAVQLYCAILSLRLIKITGARSAWSILALAIALMAGRRISTLVSFAAGNTYLEGEIITEVISLLTSILLLAGLALIGPVFSAMKKSRDDLKASEERYRVLLETMGEGFIVENEKEVITYVNERFCQMIGYWSDELIGQPIHDLLDESNKAVFLEQMQNRRRGFSDPYELNFVGQGGRQVTTLVSPVPLMENNNVFKGSSAVISDITQRTKNERELEKYRISLEELVSERTMELDLVNQELKREIQEHTKTAEQLRVKDYALRTTATAIVMADLEGRLIWVNQAGVGLWGYDNEKEMLDQTASTLFQQPEEAIQTWRRLLDRRHVATELAARKKGGSTFFIHMSVSEILNDRGLPLGWMGTIHDVTARKEIELELKKAKEEAETANQAKSLFLANMTHEIRTPMNGVIGMIELALFTDLNPEQQGYLVKAKDAADILLGIINDVLDFSKIEAGKFELDETVFNLRDCLVDSLQSLSFKARQKSLELHCRVKPGVPDYLFGDPGRLRQIVINLVSNALKFTHRGQVLLRVEVRSSREKKVNLHFSVHDTGIGIPEGSRELIFEAFSQAKNVHFVNASGTGLGLSICCQLVRMMGGEIWVESEVGRGTVFHFTGVFNLVRMAPEPLLQSLENWAGQPVLVVEANDTSGMILREIIEDLGFRPRLVRSKSAAIEVLSQAANGKDRFILAILGRNLPDGDGIELAGLINGHWEHKTVKLVMLAETGGSIDRAGMKKIGFSGCLVNPVSKSQVMKVMAAALENKYAVDEWSDPIIRHTLRKSPRSMKILVAEDNAINQEVIRTLLVKRGHEVVMVENGAQVLQVLDRHGFDLLLMDIRMPEIDGLKTAALIRQREISSGGHIPLVAMTAQATKEDQNLCLETGFDGFMVKPFKARDLFAMIENYTPSDQVLLEPEFWSEADRIVFDYMDALDSLTGQESLLRHVVDLFLSSCPMRLSDLARAVHEGNLEELQLIAHSLKGLCGQLSAQLSFQAAERLESSTRSGNGPQVTEAFEKFKKEVEKLMTVLIKYRKMSPDPMDNAETDLEKIDKVEL